MPHAQSQDVAVAGEEERTMETKKKTACRSLGPFTRLLVWLSNLYDRLQVVLRMYYGHLLWCKHLAKALARIPVFLEPSRSGLAHCH